MVIPNYLVFFIDTGYHRMWNNTVSVRHPLLWTFIRCLKDQQSSLETSIDAVNRGDAAPKRKRKWRNLEARLLRLKEEYVNGRSLQLCSFVLTTHICLLFNDT